MYQNRPFPRQLLIWAAVFSAVSLPVASGGDAPSVREHQAISQAPSRATAAGDADADSQRVQELIERLRSPRFDERERASQFFRRLVPPGSRRPLIAGLPMVAGDRLMNLLKSAHLEIPYDLYPEQPARRRSNKAG